MYILHGCYRSPLPSEYGNPPSSERPTSKICVYTPSLLKQNIHPAGRLRKYIALSKITKNSKEAFCIFEGASESLISTSLGVKEGLFLVADNWVNNGVPDNRWIKLQKADSFLATPLSATYISQRHFPNFCARQDTSGGKLTKISTWRTKLGQRYQWRIGSMISFYGRFQLCG